ncbi:MAG TPA: DUF5994 family protein [Actinomycetes bacterium]|jgi:hypothetical protein|nr:DUF5994 family protein [Actinomycetes bacterium]
MALDRNDRSAAISPDRPPMLSASRLCLRPSLPGGHGVLDGGWWPRSRDPAAELRELLAGVNSHFGQLGVIARVALNRTAWDRTPCRVAIRDRIVPVGWFRAVDPHTIILMTASGDRITLLVTPPDATAEQAAIALAMAALEGNSTHPAAILAASGLATVEPTAASMARHPSAQHRSSSSVRPWTTPAAARVPRLL